MSIAAIFTDPVTVTRCAAGAFVAGRFLPGASSALAILASVQPMSPRELLNFPEAQRAREAIKLYTETPLQTADEGAGIKADQLSWQGRAYEVKKVERWQHLGLPHYKSVAMLVEP